MNADKHFSSVFFASNRGCGKLQYLRLHNPEYYADDPNDMEVLEEVKEDKQ